MVMIFPLGWFLFTLELKMVLILSEKSNFLIFHP